MASKSLRRRRLDHQAARRIDKLFAEIADPTGRKKGDTNEQYALNLIKQLIASGQIPATRDAYITRHHSRLDFLGYDIIVPTQYGDVGIQIKSSEGHAERFRRKHPHIPCIVIPESPVKSMVAEWLKSAILAKYEYLKRGRS